MSRWFSFIDIKVSLCRKLPQQQTPFLVQRLSFRCNSARQGSVLKALSVWSRLSSGSSMWRGVLSPAASQMLKLTACLHTAWHTLTDIAPGSLLIISDHTLQMFRDCRCLNRQHADFRFNFWTSKHSVMHATTWLLWPSFKMHWWHKYVLKQLNVFVSVKMTKNKEVSSLNINFRSLLVFS